MRATATGWPPNTQHILILIPTCPFRSWDRLSRMLLTKVAHLAIFPWGWLLWMVHVVMVVLLLHFCLDAACCGVAFLAVSALLHVGHIFDHFSLVSPLRFLLWKGVCGCLACCWLYAGVPYVGAYANDIHDVSLYVWMHTSILQCGSSLAYCTS